MKKPLTKEDELLRRSYNMSQIRSKNTKPEVSLRLELFKRGYRYRLHLNRLPGKPDIVLPKYSTVIFVHGCFWHLHTSCKEGRIPNSRREYWEPKLLRNVHKDNLHKTLLEKSGWKVITIWECEIQKKLQEIVRNIERQLIE